jgi:signal peptidase II
MTTKKSLLSLYFLIGIPLIILDHLSKRWALDLPLVNYATNYPYGGVGLFDGGVQGSLNLAFNYGAAWSLMEQHPQLLLLLRIIVIIALLLFSWRRLPQTLSSHLPTILIASGALGNVFDVLYWGYVVDMIHFTFWGYHYPIFNLADSLITVGVVLYLFLCPKDIKKPV